MSNAPRKKGTLSNPIPRLFQLEKKSTRAPSLQGPPFLWRFPLLGFVKTKKVFNPPKFFRKMKVFVWGTPFIFLPPLFELVSSKNKPQINSPPFFWEPKKIPKEKKILNFSLLNCHPCFQSQKKFFPPKDIRLFYFSQKSFPGPHFFFSRFSNAFFPVVTPASVLIPNWLRRLKILFLLVECFFEKGTLFFFFLFPLCLIFWFKLRMGVKKFPLNQKFNLLWGKKINNPFFFF